MGYLIRVVNGRVVPALQKLTNLIQSDGQMKRYRRRRFYESPGEKRRRNKMENVHRAQRQKVKENLRTVFARKARGF